MTVVRATPTGDCVATAFAHPPGRSSLALTLSDAGGEGRYSFDLLGSKCGLKVVSRAGAATLDLQLYPYCDVAYHDVAAIASCAPADGAVVPMRMRLPAPDAERRIRGRGSLTLERETYGGSRLSPVELEIELDLHG